MKSFDSVLIHMISNYMKRLKGNSKVVSQQVGDNFTYVIDITDLPKTTIPFI